MNIHIIRVDGSEEDVQGEFFDVHKLIDAQVLDTINLRDGRVMLVDDAGYEIDFVELGPSHYGLQPIRARKPMNRKATDLYWSVCVPGTTHEIVGDVAVVNDAEVE